MTTKTCLRLAWLDLRGSCLWLEKLGALAYAERLNNCWLALSQQLQNTNIAVYQYVGDAVILYADENKNLADLLHTVQQFQAWAANNMDFHFRAAIHQGEIVRIERDGLLFFYGQTIYQLYMLSQTQKSQNEQDIICSASVA
jgi:class 3 adenylate cyclase